MKIVINVCFGGFGLSYEGVMAYAKKKRMTLYAYHSVIQYGTDPLKIDLIPYCGKKDNMSPISYWKKPTRSGEAIDDTFFDALGIRRDDTVLVGVVEELGEKSYGSCAELKVVEIPDGVEWEISEYDGNETIEEKHRSWS